MGFPGVKNKCAAWHSVLGHGCCHLDGFGYCPFPRQHERDLQLLFPVLKNKIKQQKNSSYSLAVHDSTCPSAIVLFLVAFGSASWGPDLSGGCRWWLYSLFLWVTPGTPGERWLALMLRPPYGAAFSLEINSSCGLWPVLMLPVFQWKTAKFWVENKHLSQKHWCTNYRNTDSPICNCKMSRMLRLKGIFPFAWS